MGKIGTLTAFTANTTAKATEVNSNFDEIRSKANTYGMWVDAACTVSVTHTFTASQTFSAGIAVTGNSTLAGTLTGLTGLTIASGGLTVGGTVTLTTAASTVIPGATSFTLRNNANSADNFKVLDSGATTIRQTLTVAAGGLAVTGNSTITGTLGGLTGLTVASGGASVAGGLTVTGAKATMAATASGYASLNLPHGTAPSSPANGDLWTTTSGVYARVNGTTQGPFTAFTALPMLTVRRASGTQSITSGSTDNITFPTQVAAVGSIERVVGDEQFIVPETGTYLLSVLVVGNAEKSLADGAKFAFRKSYSDGGFTVFAEFTGYVRIGRTASGEGSWGYSAVVRLTANESVYATFKNDSAETVVLSTSEFSVARIN